MKTSTSDLRNLLHGSTSAAFVDLITVTLADATVARWTTDTYDVVYGGNTYTAGGSGTAPIISRGRIRETTGLDVATMDLTLGCGPTGTATIGGVDIRVLARTGQLDDARVVVSRAYMASPGGTVVGTVDRFQGLMTDCEADSHEVRSRVQSELYRLNEMLPRHLIREKCSWALGDAGCGVDLTDPSFYEDLTLDAPFDRTSVGSSDVMSNPIAEYVGGTLVFTSGALTGERRSIASAGSRLFPASGHYFALSSPLSASPTAGDVFRVTMGCDKTIAKCDGTFANLTRRRGFDFVPPPDYVTR